MLDYSQRPALAPPFKDLVRDYWYLERLKLIAFGVFFEVSILVGVFLLKPLEALSCA